MRSFILLGLLFSSLLQAKVQKIEIEPQEIRPDQPVVIIEGAVKEKTMIAVDLSTSISEAVLKISADKGDLFRVNTQLEVSLGVQDEGPHLDLVDWKHCYINIPETQSISAHSFKLANLDEVVVDCFPEVSIAEIKQAIPAEAREEWLPIFDRTFFSREMNIATGISAVQLQIEQQVDSEWQVVHTLVINIPLGC